MAGFTYASGLYGGGAPRNAALFATIGGPAANGATAMSRADRADNSSPLGRGIPKGVGPCLRKGEILVDIDQLGKVRKTSDGHLIATFVLGFQDTDLGGAADLVWLKANDTFIYRATTPKRSPSSPLREHGGDQTALDPVIAAAGSGVVKTCWPGLAYVVLEDFDFTPYTDGTDLPVFTGLWTTSATTASATREESAITFSDLGSDGTWDNDTVGYDGARGVAYLQSNGTPDYLHTIDVGGNVEIRRAAMETAERFNHIVALPGSDHVVTTGVNADNSNLYCARLIDSVSGAVAATLDAVEPGGGGAWEMDAQTAVLAQSDTATKFLVFGYRWASTGINPATTPVNDGCIMLADVTNGTLEYLAHPETAPLRAAASQAHLIAWAWRNNGDGTFTAFFAESGNATIYRIEVSAGGIGTAVAFHTTDASAINGLAYDPLDDTVVLSRDDGMVIKTDLSGNVQYSADNSALGALVLNRQDNGTSGNRLAASVQPGYAGAIRSNGNPYIVDLGDGSATAISTDDWYTMFYDQYLGYYGLADFYTGTAGQAGAISRYTLSDLTPDTVDASDILTKLETYQGDYTAGDIAFSGFSGGECSGLDISVEQTIDAYVRDVCKVLGIREAHDASKVKFSIPPRDGAYALDATLADSGIRIDGITQSIADEDSAFERVILDFVDTGADYLRNTAEYVRPNGVYTVSQTSKRGTVSTQLVMSATQAAKAAQRMTYESDLDRRGYGFTLMQNGFAHEPGDVVQFAYGPADDFTIVAELRKVRLNADFTQTVEATEFLRGIETSFIGSNLVQAATVNVSTAISLTILDCALLRPSDDLGGAGLRSYAVLSAPGSANILAAALWTSDDGYSWSVEAERSDIAPVAGQITAISRNNDNAFDTDLAGTLTATIDAGDPDALATVSDAAFYRLENHAVLGAPGRWVLAAFRDVSVSGQVASLSTMIWGLAGTEVHLASLAAGDRFIRLLPDEVIAFVNAVSALDTAVYYKGGYAAWLAASLPTVKAVADGEAEKPFAPLNLSATPSAGGLTLGCAVRERLGIGPVMKGVESPGYSEGGLSVEWDVMSGSTVLRTLAAAAETKLYASADIATDFGTVPATLKLRCAQISRLGFRGHVTEQTVAVSVPATADTTALTADMTTITADAA